MRVILSEPKDLRRKHHLAFNKLVIPTEAEEPLFDSIAEALHPTSQLLRF
jgi:hypothetical protein